MSVLDLSFIDVATGSTIYDPLQVIGGSGSSGPRSVKVTNYGSDNLTNVGLYIMPTTISGDVDNPAEYPPHTDYQDLITWGTNTSQGITAVGGLKVTYTDSLGVSQIVHITNFAGSLYKNRLILGDLASGGSMTFIIELEVPVSVVSRRLFVALVVE